MTTADTVTVAGEDGAVRLDRWFKRHYPALGHSRLEKLLRTGRIRVDGKRARSSDRVAPGQAIRIPLLDEMTAPAPRAPRQALPGDEAMLRDAVLHRDDAVIVLNKPPGLAVQGGTGTERHLDGLLDALRFGSEVRPRLVHRLDKETSGVLVLARTVAAAAFLTRAFREKTTRKIYWAIVVGLPKLRQGRIDLALAKLPGREGERVRADAEEGKRAITYYQVVDSVGSSASWLALLPVTGRTHQLRAHCAAIGTPILGDAKYGAAAVHLTGVPDAKRLHLHARSLSIPHPLGDTLRVTAPLPPHMRRSWEFFGFPDDIEDPFADLFRHEALLQEGRARAGCGRSRRRARRQARQDLGEARPGRAEFGACRSDGRGVGRSAARNSPSDDAADAARRRHDRPKCRTARRGRGAGSQYAGTDLVCYRAAHPPALAARQQAVWQPLIDWAARRYDAPLAVTTGVVPKSQPAASLAAFAEAVAARDDFH